MGRPTDCTPENTALAEAAVAELGSYEAAVAELPFDRSTFYEWMQRGRSGESPYADFRDAVLSARARWQSERLRRIQAAAGTRVRQVVDKLGDVHDLEEPGDWNADRWLLMVMEPALYNPRTKVFEFRSMLQFLERGGVVLDQEQLVRLVALVWRVDEATLRNVAGSEDVTGENAQRIAATALREIRKSKNGSNGST